MTYVSNTLVILKLLQVHPLLVGQSFVSPASLEISSSPDGLIISEQYANSSSGIHAFAVVQKKKKALVDHLSEKCVLYHIHVPRLEI